MLVIIEGSLEVKFPTCGKMQPGQSDESAEREREREREREGERGRETADKTEDRKREESEERRSKCVQCEVALPLLKPGKPSSHRLPIFGNFRNRLVRYY